jgi:hypothetical protein
MSLTSRTRTLVIDLLVRFVHLPYPLSTLTGRTSHHAEERTRPTFGLAVARYQQSCQPDSVAAARPAVPVRAPYVRFSRDAAVQPGQSHPTMRHRRYRAISGSPMLTSISQVASRGRSLPSGRVAPGQMPPSCAATNQAALGRVQRPCLRVSAVVRRPGMPRFPIHLARTGYGRAALIPGH